MPSSLPPNPDIDWLRKRAKERLAVLRVDTPDAKLHQAQRLVASELGFSSWRALKAEVDRISVPGRAVRFARTGDVIALRALLDEHPSALSAHGGEWDRPLLHHAAEHGHLGCVDLLLERGADVGTRDRFDSATALHWAAGEGHVEVVRRLLAAGGDPDDRRDAHVVGPLGWATCLGTVHEAAADELVLSGATVHIFAAVGLGRADLVDAALAADPLALQARMSRFEHRRTPLHLAVVRDDPALVRHLLARGADPGASDETGTTPLGATTRRTHPDVADALLAAGADIREQEANAFHEIVPILGVTDMADALGYYEEQLGFAVAFEYGEPTDFACVTRDGMSIYLCTAPSDGSGQTPPGAWLSIWMADVDRLHEEYVASGADVDPPTDFPRGAREMKVRDPSGNVIRMSTVIDG